MKKTIIYVCIVFTVIVLFTSFSSYKNTDGTFNEHYQVDEIVVGNQKYIVMTTNTREIDICKW